MGHVLQLKREGIPGVGAHVHPCSSGRLWLRKQMPKNALAEARWGLRTGVSTPGGHQMLGFSASTQEPVLLALCLRRLFLNLTNRSSSCRWTGGERWAHCRRRLISGWAWLVFMTDLSLIICCRPFGAWNSGADGTRNTPEAGGLTIKSSCLRLRCRLVYLLALAVSIYPASMGY